MNSVYVERGRVNVMAVFEETMAEVQSWVRERLQQEVERKLGDRISEILQRAPYERRAGVGEWVEVSGQCSKCKSRQSQRFSRNGGRERTLLTMWGLLSLWVQRLVCECGGSVRLEVEGWLRPYQRIGDDVDAQIHRWGGLSLSLRQMQCELGQLYIGPLAIRTLNQRLHRLHTLASVTDPLCVPPILQIDAIWVTQLVPKGGSRRDAKGRKRAKKSRIKRPIFIAMGVWPDRNEAQILAWYLGQSESEEAWVEFLSHVEALGIRGEEGLELIIHDGGSGLCAALRTVWFDAAQQRCLFHKLRNLYQAIQISDESLSKKQQRRQRKAIFKDFHHIWQAKRLSTVLRRYIKVVRQYRTSQPKAVATLRRNFRHTITYFYIHQRHPLWPLTHLRTTSRLERYNRCLRRRCRSAGAYHSDEGLAAMLAQEAHLFNSSQLEFQPH